MRPLVQFAYTRMEENRRDSGSDRLVLSEHDIDVWRIALDHQPPEAVVFMTSLLSLDEKERAGRFYFERDRTRYIVGRAVVRMTLARYLGRRPQELVFRYGPNGKPALTAESGTPAIHFNVAHSEGLALLACTRVGEVGIDVEFIRELSDWERVAEAAFSAHELAQLRACPIERRRDEFFRAWTRQEAVLKALGTGLVGATDAAAESAFHVYPLDVAPGYAAAFAASPIVRQPGAVRDWADSGAGKYSSFNPASKRAANTHLS